MKLHKKTLPKKQASNSEKVLCIIGYSIIPIFFIILYCIMFMSYEDLYQSYAWADKTVPEITQQIYFQLPRIGEIFQRIAVHFMSLSTSFGLDLLFRLITAIMSILCIYLGTYFILKRKPQLRYEDTLIYLGLFLILMISEVSETFTFRFSYANNYIIATTITLGFLLPFRLKVEKSKLWQKIGMVFLGICFGMSTEIGPIAILAILAIWTIFKFFKKEIDIKNFYRKYKLQIFGILGAIIGLVLVFGNGSLSRRAGSSYGEFYDYVSIMDIFKNNLLSTLYKLWQHAWYNLRYLMFAPIIIGLIIFTESAISKKINKASNNLPLHICILYFFILYMCASCQIRVLDDLYPRYFFLVYMSIFISILAFVDFIFRNFSFTNKTLRRSTISLATLSLLALIDMFSAFLIYRMQINDQLYKIQPDYENKNVLITEEYSRTTMIPSPIFKFAQLSPFDWGNLGDGAMKYGYGPKYK